MRTFSQFLAILVVIASGSAFGATPDATITFTGTFWQPSCQVDSTTANQTINLDPATAVSLATSGSTANPAAFSLGLINCAAGTKVTMSVTGTIDTVPSVLKNTGTAQRVGVQILQATSAQAKAGSPITLNAAINLGVVDSTNSMSIPFVAQYYSLGTPTGGTVAATATVNFTYN